MSNSDLERTAETSDPAIMRSIDDLNDAELYLGTNLSKHQSSQKSCLLIDENENLKVLNAKEFVDKLGRGAKDVKIKVVSIFGNTGDGKSHTMNQVFFKGKEVFKTSTEQVSCTLGVWMALDSTLDAICLDTEGLWGMTTNDNKQMRLLLKVLAISDVVIYYTRSERLNRDLFTFLGTASHAYKHHFEAALQAVSQRENPCNSSRILGPSIVVLHETTHTRPLTNNGLQSAEDILEERFAQMRLETGAFSSIKYVGLWTVDPPTNYEPLRRAIKQELDNTTVRSARRPYLVYNTLKLLNDKFSGHIENFNNALFPDQYFTCSVKCLCCGSKCENGMGHLREGKSHHSESRCLYQRRYENMVYMCKKCYSTGKEVVVTSRYTSNNETGWYGLVRYAWSGCVIECPDCGEIHRSRRYWYGNDNPEDECVRMEIVHVWNASHLSITSQNAAQKVLDGVSSLTETVSRVSLQPTKALTAWVADQVAPAYWKANHEIKNCFKCKTPFGPTDAKHHCRACGEGFCAECSSRNKSVPTRNWHEPVRVCDMCYGKDFNCNDDYTANAEQVNCRKVSEKVVSTLNAVGTVYNYSKSLIKDQVRPTYWIPDSEVNACCICETKFSLLVLLHHCRDCGRGVCQDCSLNSKPVPYRGWNNPVRVCDSCIKID